MLSEKKKAKEIQKIYPELKKNTIYRCKKDPIKYSLRENDIFQISKQNLEEFEK